MSDRVLITAQLSIVEYHVREAFGVAELPVAAQLALETALLAVLREERARAATDRLRCLRDGYAHGLDDARRELGLQHRRAVPPPIPGDASARARSDASPGAGVDASPRAAHHASPAPAPDVFDRETMPGLPGARRRITG